MNTQTPPQPLETGPAMDAGLLARMGVRLCLQGRYAESLEALEKAAGLSPGDVEILNNLAVVQERAGQAAAALETFRRSLGMVREQPEIFLLLGNLERGQGNAEAAREAYEAALALEPRFAVAWQSLGLLHQAQRRLPEAIECMLESLRHAGEKGATGAVYSILGQLYYETGQVEKAREAYATAVGLDGGNAVYHLMLREMEFACAALRGEPLEGALEAYDRSHVEHPAAEDKDRVHLLQCTFALLRAYGHGAAAHQVAALRARLYPESATAAYLLRAAAGDEAVTRSPDAYIVESFDTFAERFDEHLVGTLRYDIPQKLAAAVGAYLPAGPGVRTLDAGCGTGLCAGHLRRVSRVLVGVDLSPKMLARARERKIYDELHCAELTGFLEGYLRAFDFVCAADVLIYFGDLQPVAAALAGALVPGGLLAFSTETGSGGEDGRGYRLLTSGRFAHDPAGVSALFGANFEQLVSEETTVRLEGGRPVVGRMFVFRRV